MIECLDMNKRIILRIISYMLLAAFLLTSLGGCTTWNNFNRAFINKPVYDEETIKIGVFEPLTGELAKEAEDEIRGIELAHSIYSNTLNSQIELVYIDNRSDAEFVPEAAQEMIDSGVSIVVGSCGNMISLTAGEIFKEAQLPAVTASCTNPLITQTNEYYARACYIESFEARGAADYIYRTYGEPAAAVMYYEDNDLAKTQADEFTEFLMKISGADHINTAELPTGIEDLSEIFLALKGRGIKAVFLPENIETANSIIAKARELGYDFLWIGTSEWKGITTEGVCYTVDFDPEETLSSMTQRFLRAYAEKYGAGNTPSEYVALGFDAYLIAREAVRLAGTGDDRVLIASKLTAINGLSGATGTITMDDNGDPIKNIVIRQITNGKPETVYTSVPGREE